MIPWLIALGYFFGTILTLLWGRSTYVNLKYQKELEKYKKYSHYESDELHFMQMALRKAKRDFDADLPVIVFGCFFWPVYLVGLIGYKVIKTMPTIKIATSKAEREVKAFETQKKLSAARKAEWRNALQTLREAGIDTTELRKIKID